MRKITKYVAHDGTEFDGKDECELHEYALSVMPDITELVDKEMDGNAEYESDMGGGPVMTEEEVATFIFKSRHALVDIFNRKFKPTKETS